MTIGLDLAPALDRVTTVSLRPRYEGCNICTWIGFKHVNYLVEEAVLTHLREAGLAAGALYETYGLGTELVDIDTRIATALHIDDVVTAEVRPAADGAGRTEGRLALTVQLSVDRDAVPVKAATSQVGVVFRQDAGCHDAPAEAAPHTVRRVTGTAGAKPPSPPDRVGSVEEAVGLLKAQGNTEVWRWRVPYYHCHFTERLQMSGLLRVMEEAVHWFLQERGVSIRTLLTEQDWIPVVPHSAITMLDETLMEEELLIAFTVEDVFKDLTYTARVDTYALRDGALVPTSTGRITHGYAHIDSRRDWSLTRFDERLQRALRGAGQ
jgi:acyl-CoA thioesterase FadM